MKRRTRAAITLSVYISGLVACVLAVLCLGYEGVFFCFPAGVICASLPALIDDYKKAKR